MQRSPQPNRRAKAPCPKCGKLCDYGSRQFENYVWCPKCKVYNVPKLRLLE